MGRYTAFNTSDCPYQRACHRFGHMSTRTANVVLYCYDKSSFSNEIYCIRHDVLSMSCSLKY